MTVRMKNAFFSGSGFCRMATMAAALALAGCAGGGAVDGAAQSGQGARDTGTYPNLNIKPQVAAEQFTDAERDAKLSELKADRDRAAGGIRGGARNDAPALNRLAKSHGNETLQQIEGKCDPALDPTCK